MANDETIHVYPRDDSGGVPRTWRPADDGAVLVKCPECGTASTVAVGSIDSDGATGLCCPAKACRNESKVRLVGWSATPQGLSTALPEGS